MSASPSLKLVDMGALTEAHHAQRRLRLGLWLGLLGVVIFAATLPLTKLAVGTPSSPQLTPWFITFGRAAVAGLLSFLYLTIQYRRGLEAIFIL